MAHLVMLHNSIAITSTTLNKFDTECLGGDRERKINVTKKVQNLVYTRFYHINPSVYHSEMVNI